MAASCTTAVSVTALRSAKWQNVVQVKPKLKGDEESSALRMALSYHTHGGGTANMGGWTPPDQRQWRPPVRTAMREYRRAVCGAVLVSNAGWRHYL